MNNIHFDYPALMSDGRNYSTWQPTAVLNDQIRKKENIKTNWDYREYLQKNANSIMDFDKHVAFSQTGGSYSYSSLQK
jgi:hypothetical protein